MYSARLLRRRAPTRSPSNRRSRRWKSDVLAYWEADGTFQASIDARAGGENGSNEYVFYDGPPFANGLPHYGHLLTGYAKDVVPRYQTMRGQPGRAPVRLGHARTARRARGASGSSASPTSRRSRRWASPRSTRRAASRCCATRASGGVRHPPGALGRLRQRLQDARHHLHGVGDLGVQALYDKGLAYEGYRVLPYCWRDETPLSNHELRMDDDVYQMRQDPAVTVGFRLAGRRRALGLTARTRSSGRRRRGRCRRNLAIAVGPDIEYVMVRADDGKRYVLAEARLAAYAKELGEEPDDRGAVQGRATCAARRYAPPFDYFAGPRERAPGAGRRLRDHRGRHGHRAHRPRLR